MKKLVLAFILCIFLINLASAFEFDNIKTYPTGTYSPIDKIIIIKNSFLGIPLDDVAQLQLLTPQHVIVSAGLDKKVAEIKINNYDDNYINALKQLEFYNLKSNDKPLEPRNFVYKQKIEKGEIDVDDYSLVCKLGEKNAINGTTPFVCSNEKVGSHKEMIYDYIPLEKMDITKGEIIIGIFTDVKDGEKVEWILTAYGKELIEWADFGTATKIEWNEDLVDDYQSILSNSWEGQTFNIGAKSGLTGNYTLKGISLKLTSNNGGEASSFCVNIGNGSWTSMAYNCSLNSNALPNGASTNVFYNISLPNIIVNSSISLTWWINYSSLTFQPFLSQIKIGTYSGGSAFYNLGVGWISRDPRDDPFQLWGDIYSPTNPDPQITTTSYYPANGLNITYNNITFNATLTPNGYCNLTNATLYLWNGITSAINRTTLQTLATNINISYNVTFNELLTTDLNYTWNVFGCCSNGTATNCSFSATNRTITRDTTNPNINLIYPADNTNYSDNVTGLNYTINDVNLQACWYSLNLGSVNTTLTCGTNATGLTSNEGSNTWKIYANDTFGNINSSTSIFFKDSIYPLISYGTGTLNDGENSFKNANKKLVDEQYQDKYDQYQRGINEYQQTKKML